MQEGRLNYRLEYSLNIAVASEVFEDDNGSSFVSEEDSETQSVSSFSSGPTSPCEVPTQFPPATRPGSLDLPSPVSLSEFGMIFPVLGPRSECSGASSPECEAERGMHSWIHPGPLLIKGAGKPSQLPMAYARECSELLAASVGKELWKVLCLRVNSNVYNVLITVLLAGHVSQFYLSTGV